MDASTLAREQRSRTPAWKRRLARRLLDWFDRHARPLPWRATRDPYPIWVSEVMLQQTQVATVVAYYRRFIEALPTIAALAAADEQQVLKLWEGLGYYRRARQLHAAARHICERHGGEFPSEREAVHALPGVGRYTAGAVLSIAFDAREPILEANSMRVLSRLLAYRDDPRGAAGQRHLWQAAEDLLPRRRIGTFNQALMELGSEICTTREPKCHACPLAQFCPTRLRGLQSAIPAPSRKPAIQAVHQAALVLQRPDGRILLVRRGPGERWAGMWDFPRFELDDVTRSPVAYLQQQATALGRGPVTLGERILTLRHVVTRFRITLDCYAAHIPMPTKAAAPDTLKSPRRPRTKWFRPAEMEPLPMNVTGRKIARFIVQQG
ncbi:MAG: A/G-specific adenine glycosylase [Pirellulales bacterium]|nr:A/G-specific adenine glycosylase [Pirellulales bacterium]